MRNTLDVDAAEVPPNSEEVYDGKADGIEDGSTLLIVTDSGGVVVIVAVTGGEVTGTLLLILESKGIDVPGGSEYLQKPSPEDLGPHWQ